MARDGNLFLELEVAQGERKWEGLENEKGNYEDWWWSHLKLF